MSRTLTATETKAKILSLLNEVAAGEVIEITKYGRVVARLVPPLRPGDIENSLAGVVSVADPNDDLLSAGVTWEFD